MGTKAEPGEFDCYSKLGPDEPYFVLRAKDPHAATIVRLWAQHRLQSMTHGTHPMSDMAKTREAVLCAAAMDEWRERNVK